MRRMGIQLCDIWGADARGRLGKEGRSSKKGSGHASEGQRRFLEIRMGGSRSLLYQGEWPLIEKEGGTQTEGTA